MFVEFSFQVAKDGVLKKGPAMGSGDMDLLKKNFPSNFVWKCEKSNEGNQMFPTVRQMYSLYIAMLEYAADNYISPNKYQTGNFGSLPKVMSSAKSLFDDLFRFCEHELGFERPQHLEIRISRRQAEEILKRTERAKRVRKKACVVQTERSLYDIGESDQRGKRKIVRRGRPLSETTTGQIIRLRIGEPMRFFLEGDEEEFKSTNVLSIR